MKPYEVTTYGPNYSNERSGCVLAASKHAAVRRFLTRDGTAVRAVRTTKTSYENSRVYYEVERKGRWVETVTQVRVESGCACVIGSRQK
jgi:hypothetical protein